MMYAERNNAEKILLKLDGAKLRDAILHRNPSKRLGRNKLKLNYTHVEWVRHLAPLYMKSQSCICRK